jgi:hypothetical protein
MRFGVLLPLLSCMSSIALFGSSGPQCVAMAEVTLASSGTLTFPGLDGYAANASYKVAKGQSSYGTVGIDVCPSELPKALGADAAAPFALTLMASGQVSLTITLRATLPANAAPGTPYGFQVFDGYTKAVKVADVAATVNGATVSTAGSFGLSLMPAHTYVIELVKNPGPGQVPKPRATDRR